MISGGQGEGRTMGDSMTPVHGFVACKRLLFLEVTLKTTVRASDVGMSNSNQSLCCRPSQLVKFLGWIKWCCLSPCLAGPHSEVIGHHHSPILHELKLENTNCKLLDMSVREILPLFGTHPVNISTDSTLLTYIL